MGVIKIIYMQDPKIIFGRLGNSLFQYAYIYAQMKRGEIPDIFIQDPKYFEEFKDEIKALFSGGIGYLPYVAMHVRRGKNPINPEEPAYSENPFYTNLLTTDYYAKAIDHFPRRKFLIFSDDMEYCKENFKGEIFGYDESETDLESFNKMASCESIIMANSSFSWWASYICPNVEPNMTGKIVCPSETVWYSDGVVRTKLPPEWIQIEAKKLSTPELEEPRQQDETILN